MGKDDRLEIRKVFNIKTFQVYKIPWIIAFVLGLTFPLADKQNYGLVPLSLLIPVGIYLVYKASKLVNLARHIVSVGAIPFLIFILGALIGEFIF
jgi:hypothetical protein